MTPNGDQSSEEKRSAGEARWAKSLDPQHLSAFGQLVAEGLPQVPEYAGWRLGGMEVGPAQLRKKVGIAIAFVIGFVLIAAYPGLLLLTPVALFVGVLYRIQLEERAKERVEMTLEVIRRESIVDFFLFIFVFSQWYLVKQI
jgi:hypothetical protein